MLKGSWIIDVAPTAGLRYGITCPKALKGFVSVTHYQEGRFMGFPHGDLVK